MTRSRPGAFELPVTERKKAFERRLLKAAKEIKEEAQGRRCGDCERYVGGLCDATASIFETEVVGHSPDAIACGHWRPREGAG